MGKAPTVLRLAGIYASYGQIPVLHGVDLEVGHGEIVAVIGHNGAGKSTLLKCAFGLMPLQAGHVEVEGEPVSRLTPRTMIGRGVAFAAQGNRVLDDFTVEEHLRLAGATLGSALLDQRVGHAFQRYRVLNERRAQKAGSLSGGEKQVLLLASTLLTRPRVLLLDEPSLGLAPSAVRTVFHELREMCAADGVSMLVVEQKVREILMIADRVSVLRRGAVAYETSGDEARENSKEVERAFL